MVRFFLRRFRGIMLARFALSLLAIVAIFGMASSPVFALGGQNGSLSGTVIDAATKAPVANATVAIAAPSGNYRATTDSKGHFNFTGVFVDTYTLTIQAPGFTSVQQAGVTVTGDQAIDLGTISLSKQLRTIGRTVSRSAAGAFQPNQTVDSYTVTGSRAIQALGKAENVNENQLLLSVPGTSTTDTGRVTIRGGLANEVGYQLNGVPFTEPFFSQNASDGRINGLGSVQVVEGAGDATQGNIGSGLVNVIPKRGTYPGAGLVDAEVGGPNFSHQFGIEYGIATRSGNLSNYFTYVGNRFAPYYGYSNQNPANTGFGNYFGNTLESNDDLLDNLVFKFGHENRQSLEFLYNTRTLQGEGEVGGLTDRYSYLYDPYILQHGAFGSNPFVACAFCATGPTGGPLDPEAASLFGQYTGLTPYARTNGQPLTTPATAFNDPTRLINFQYDNNLDDKTLFTLRYYNFIGQEASNDTFDSNSNAGYSIIGGQRVGGNFELTRTIGQHTLTLQGQLENQKPQWNDYAPLETLAILGANGTSLTDFLPGSVNSYLTGGADTADGYVYSHLGYMRIPTVGINYDGTDFQVLGAGIRDQWALSDKVKFDYGVRVDHANYKFGPNPYNPGDPGNPEDVDPSFITASFAHPNAVEPRFAFSLQPTKDDAIRFGFGRSVEFLNAQTAGTPGGMYGAEQLFGLPPTPGSNTSNPATWTCGSGLNSSLLLPSGANSSGRSSRPDGKPGGFFQCQNYAQQLYWAYDQNFDAPDIGNGTAPTYTNLDLTYSHNFKNGFGLRTTGFVRRSTGLPGFFVLAEKTDPATGSILYEVFSVNNLALSKTSGVEFELTTPERPVGFSGYLSATYQNAISSIPPLVPTEDELPLVTTQSLQLGDTYRAGFLSPVAIDVGGTYATRGGFKITPDVEFNAGYPFGTGTVVAYNGLINGKAYNVPLSNLGGSQPTINGFNGSTGAATSTQYVDPAYPGSILNPNIAATRGEKETSAAGGELTNPSFTANLTAQYTFGRRNTIGLQVNNLFGNIYAGTTPVPNTYYQPVTTGVAGPTTSYVTQANPAETSYANHGYVNIPNSSYGNSPFLLLPNVPTTFTVYYQLGL